MSEDANHRPNTLISIEVDGHPVTGVITERWERVIEVRLGSPFGNARLTSALVTPLFGWAVRVREGFTDGYLGEAGDFAAARLLEELYRKAVLFDRHRDELQARWEACQAELRAHEAENPEARLRIETIEARRRFRSGEIGQKEYQRIRKGLTTIREAFDGRTREIERSFMDEPAPWAAEHPDVDLGQVVRFLEMEEGGG